MTGHEIKSWIIERLNDNMTVYCSTHLKSTKLKKKHIPLLLSTNTDFYIKCGKSKICYTYCKFTATKE